ncbi:unnamed protein product [Brassicogethes aeneus]|uniref:Nose resistant-to-fluoxetine protein N-terminal domain-containing protein n=1 Tax=Brassicogethes aeneus TaxID=1431903 RepID=A0A9P0FKY5_BRAAE|nr:unnamed protein product [Brassicogethes aeneus]
MGRKMFALVFVLGVFNCAHCVDDTLNDTFVMKIKPVLEPRTLISNYNHDRKEKWKKHILTEENKESNVTEKPTGGGISFPRSLEIIPQILAQIENEKCVYDTVAALEGMAKHERWTLEMFDASPKFPVGILTGNHYQLGNFDECMRVKQPLPEDANYSIKGQYCLTDIYFNHRSVQNSLSINNLKTKNRYSFNNSVIHWGICIPDSCNEEDAKIFVQEIFKSTVDNVETVEVTIGKNKCQVEKSFPLNQLEIIYGSIIGFFIMFIFFATFFHCWTLRRRQNYVAYNVESVREKNSTLKSMVLCFSMIRTVKQFLHTSPNDLNLECIYGIKFLSMMFIIAGHTLIFIAGGPVDNIAYVNEQAYKVKNGVFFNSALLVDTFLIISGFLMCRLLLIELDKRKGKLNILVLYIARYIRLTPAYIVIIGFYSTFLIRIGSGPLWKSKIGLEQERCLKSWWINILYVNNYFNTEYLCMFQSWYLAVDYHLFIVAPFIIVTLWKWKNIGKTLLAALMVPSIAVPFWLTYKNEMDPTLLAFPPEIEDLSTNHYFATSYIKTHMRTNSYLIGLLFGYIIHRLQTSGTKIPTYIVWIGSIIATVTALLAMFSIVVFLHPDHEKNVLENAIYSPLHRVAWCLSIGWLLIICVTDNAEIVSNFLSWKFFIPLSRLTYCAYLVNGLVVITHAGSLRQNSYMNFYELLVIILAHLLITFFLAFVVCIFFESPIHGLEKILLSKHKSSSQKPQSNANIRPVEER